MNAEQFRKLKNRETLLRGQIGALFDELEKLLRLFPRKELVRCANCGSTRVEMLVWADANTDKAGGGTDCNDDTYCSGCELNGVSLLTPGDPDPDEFPNERED